MIQEFCLDLRAARRNSGLRQVDCAHLMDVQKSKISNLETGRQRPTVKDICMLSMIYGRSFETLFAGIFSEVREELEERLPGLREPSPHYKRAFNRKNTLDGLEARLKDNPDHFHA
ncbi:MAG: helix-turn-helix domain-containing protein [Paracoccaceae bacterium]